MFKNFIKNQMRKFYGSIINKKFCIVRNKYKNYKKFFVRNYVNLKKTE